MSFVVLNHSNGVLILPIIAKIQLLVYNLDNALASIKLTVEYIATLGTGKIINFQLRKDIISIQCRESLIVNLQWW